LGVAAFPCGVVVDFDGTGASGEGGGLGGVAGVEDEFVAGDLEDAGEALDAEGAGAAHVLGWIFLGGAAHGDAASEEGFDWGGIGVLSGHAPV
jgi:hypothetical protein